MSTGPGMRRILKRNPKPSDWIRQKYNKGLYDPRDPSIPTTHEIFSWVPLPDLDGGVQPVSRREAERIHKRTFEPTQRAVRMYMYRKQKDPAEAEAGNQPSSSAYGRAYDFAIRQLGLQRSEGYSEEEAIAKVDEILAKEDAEERRRSREVAETLAAEAAEVAREKERNRSVARGTVPEETKTDPSADDDPKNDDDDSADCDDDDDLLYRNTEPSPIHGDPRKAMQLSLWGERLQRIPYSRWTVGAATALDHWIATSVLGMSELSWRSLLEGSEEAGTARARDIITVRKTLFPETEFDDGSPPEEEDEDEYDALTDDDDDDDDDVRDRVDKLLSGLMLDNEENDDKNEAMLETSNVDDDFYDYDYDEDDTELLLSEAYQIKTEQLIENLQTWRKRSAKTPFEKWDQVAKDDFEAYLTEYINHVTPVAQRPGIDLEATREALLSVPPMDRDESDRLFSRLSDETEAQRFLDQLYLEREKKMATGVGSVEDGDGSPQRDTDNIDDAYWELRGRLHGTAPPHSRSIEGADATVKDEDDDNDDDDDPFWNLSYDEQLRRLVAFGTLRPLQDDYVPEHVRRKFLRDHQDLLLRDLPVETLVEASRKNDVGSATISSDSLYFQKRDERLLPVDDSGAEELESGWNKGETKQYRIDLRPYGDATREEFIRECWNEYVSARATHGEELLTSGKVTLDGTPLVTHEDDEDFP